MKWLGIAVSLFFLILVAEAGGNSNTVCVGCGGIYSNYSYNSSEYTNAIMEEERKSGDTFDDIRMFFSKDGSYAGYVGMIGIPVALAGLVLMRRNKKKDDEDEVIDEEFGEGASKAYQDDDDVIREEFGDDGE